MSPSWVDASGTPVGAPSHDHNLTECEGSEHESGGTLYFPRQASLRFSTKGCYVAGKVERYSCQETDKFSSSRISL